MYPPQDDFRYRSHDDRRRPGLLSSAVPASAPAVLGDRRASIALRSAAAILFGILFLWPSISDATLFRLFAAYAFVDGILALAPGGWSLPYVRSWPLLIGGCIDFIGAAAVYVLPGMTPPLLADVAAIWAAALGASFAAACWTLRAADTDYLLLACAIASLIFSRALMSQLAGDVIVLSAWMGLYALTMGVLLLKVALRHYLLMLLD